MTTPPTAATPDGLAVVSLPAHRVDEAATLMAQAFIDDPTYAVLVPARTRRGRPESRPERISRIATVLAAEIRMCGLENVDACVAESTDGTGQLLGVATWTPPAGAPHRVSLVQRLKWGVATSVAMGWSGVRATVAYEKAAAAYRPDAPHWHLLDIVASTEARGRGVGGALLRRRLAIVDGAGEAACLEATTEGSQRLYARHGFEVNGQLPAELGGAFTMVRAPRSTGSRTS